MRDMTKRVARLVLLEMLTVVLVSAVCVQAQEPNLDEVAEKHVMVPMRDGKRLSVYLYVPEGKGP